MKPNNSEIITFPKDQLSNHGMQHGALGLETLESFPKHINPEQAEMLKQCCQHLVNSQIDCKSDVAFYEMALEKLTQPVTSKWLFGRVATLQAHYYTQAMPEELMEALGMDWYEELKQFPAWAINNACRWWMSSENEKRRYKPICGDISARARTELGIASIIKLRLKQRA